MLLIIAITVAVYYMYIIINAYNMSSVIERWFSVKNNNLLIVLLALISLCLLILLLYIFTSKKKKVQQIFDYSYQIVTVKAELRLIDRIFSKRSFSKALIMFIASLMFRLLIMYIGEIDLNRDIFDNPILMVYFGILCLYLVGISELISYYEIDIFPNINNIKNYISNKFINPKHNSINWIHWFFIPTKDKSIFKLLYDKITIMRLNQIPSQEQESHLNIPVLINTKSTIDDTLNKQQLYLAMNQTPETSKELVVRGKGVSKPVSPFKSTGQEIARPSGNRSVSPSSSSDTRSLTKVEPVREYNHVEEWLERQKKYKVAPNVKQNTAFTKQYHDALELEQKENLDEKENRFYYSVIKYQNSSTVASTASHIDNRITYDTYLNDSNQTYSDNWRNAAKNLQMYNQIEIGATNRYLNKALHIHDKILKIFRENPDVNMKDSLNKKVGDVLSSRIILAMLHYYPIVYTYEELVAEPTLYEFMLHLYSCFRDTLETLTIIENQFSNASSNYLYIDYPYNLKIKNFANRHPIWYKEIVYIIENHGSPELQNYLKDTNNEMTDVLISLQNYKGYLFNMRTLYIMHMHSFESTFTGNIEMGTEQEILEIEKKRKKLYIDEAKHKNAERIPTSVLDPIALSRDRYVSDL